MHTSRGAAFGDVNGDGGIDIVVVNRDAQAYLLMNQNLGGGGFVSLQLRTTFDAPAQDAVVRFILGGIQMRREARTSGGYCSAHDPTVHIGVGSETAISEVEITWSDGSKQLIGDVKAGEVRTIHQGK